MPKHIWINPTGINVPFGQVAWQGNIPNEGKVLGFYLEPYSQDFRTTANISSFINTRYCELPVVFNDAFGAVWYSKTIKFIASKSANGNRLIFFGGDLFQFPLEIKESLLSVAMTQVYPDWLDSYAVSTNVIDGSMITLGTALLVSI